MTMTPLTVAASLHHNQLHEYQAYPPLAIVADSLIAASGQEGLATARSDVVDACLFPTDNETQFADLSNKYADQLATVAVKAYEEVRTHLAERGDQSFPEKGVDADIAVYGLSTLLKNEAAARLLLGEREYGRMTHALHYPWRTYFKDGPMAHLHATNGGDGAREISDRWHVGATGWVERLVASGRKAEPALEMADLAKIVTQWIVVGQLNTEHALYGQIVSNRRAFEASHGWLARLLQK